MAFTTATFDSPVRFNVTVDHAGLVRVLYGWAPIV